MATAPSGENANQGPGGLQSLNVIDRFRVAPAAPPSWMAPPLPPQAALELTYLDMFFIPLPPAQRLFLYRLSEVRDVSHDNRFRDSHLPRLKRALALALAVFYPLAGHFVTPDGAIPFLRYRDGDSVELTVAESQDDFEAIARDAPKESTRMHALVPVLQATSSQLEEGQEQLPVLAAQVTLFTGSGRLGGLALGVTVSHAAADGSSSTHFIKTWAALCRHLVQNHDLHDGSAVAALNIGGAAGGLPVFDRLIVQDPNGLREIYYADILEFKKTKATLMPSSPPPKLLRATFPLSRADLDALRLRAEQPPGTRYSSFTVASALAWVCSVKARGNLNEPEKMLSFMANFRSRARPQQLPPAYFGNCIDIAGAKARTADLVGDRGLALAAATVWKEVQGINDGGLFVRLGANAFKEMMSGKLSEILSIGGSPSFGLYDVDFGWGRPVKVELVSCEKTGGISLAETSDGRGGIEVGIPLPPEAMEEFVRLWRSAVNVDG